MEDRLVEFANVLRRNGVRVSVAENMDALRALNLVGIRDRAMFRNTLRTTLIKRSVDLKTFDELFDLFFLGIGQALSDMDRRLMSLLGLNPAQYQQLLEQIDEFLKKLEGDISELTRALLVGDLSQIERLLRRAAQRAGENEQAGWMANFFGLTGDLDLDRVHGEFDRIKGLLLKSLGEGEDAERLAQYLDQRLRDLQGLVREALHQEQLKKGHETYSRNRSGSLADKSFAFYTEEDIHRMNDAVAQLAQRLKNRLSVRRKGAKKGRFDVKDTLRKNLQFGGVPFRIQLDRRRKEKPQVLILCDISDSVLNASRFMLQFVYSVQDLYSKVRSFVFVSDIGEVTKLFEDREINQAVESALKGDCIDVYVHSNFGRAFEQFHKNFFTAVTSKTTCVIIGDGRNNYNRPNDWVLREIQQKAKQLIWLNPESKMTWGVGDSEMPRYAPFCDVVEECRNIAQLHKVIDLIVP